MKRKRTTRKRRGNYFRFHLNRKICSVNVQNVSLIGPWIFWASSKMICTCIQVLTENVSALSTKGYLLLPEYLFVSIINPKTLDTRTFAAKIKVYEIKTLHSETWFKNNSFQTFSKSLEFFDIQTTIVEFSAGIDLWNETKKLRVNFVRKAKLAYSLSKL